MRVAIDRLMEFRTMLTEEIKKIRTQREQITNDNLYSISVSIEKRFTVYLQEVDEALIVLQQHQFNSTFN